jgi:hypothetical protein
MMDFLVLVFVLFLGGAITIGGCMLLANWIADWQDD